MPPEGILPDVMLLFSKQCRLNQQRLVDQVLLLGLAGGLLPFSVMKQAFLLLSSLGKSINIPGVALSNVGGVDSGHSILVVTPPWRPPIRPDYETEITTTRNQIK